MKECTEYCQIPTKTCSLCNKSSETEGISLIYYGEWMFKKDVTAHYYCLLLSTHLPQRGEDHSGILGFLLRDIRHEITMAKKRKCMYCFETSASIQCFTCKNYFHLTCGHTNKCLSQFVGEFKSFCNVCLSVDEFQMELFAREPPRGTELCCICAQIMKNNPKYWIYANCCANGFTHSKCMKIYALSAGYYLACIWCKSKRFREDVKYLGVFVPDREAKWEKENGSYYKDFYVGHKRCDMETCNCPKGRDYKNAFKWQLIICKLCGASGAHNPACIPGFESSKEKLQEFKCNVCSVTEQTICKTPQDLVNTSLYVNKYTTCEIELTETHGQSLNMNSSNDSIIILQKTTVNNSCSSTPAILNNFKTGDATQSPQYTQQHESAESGPTKIEKEIYSDSDDSIITGLLAQNFLDIFDV